MTGEDMIIKAAAKLLREARDDEYESGFNSGLERGADGGSFEAALGALYKS